MCFMVKLILLSASPRVKCLLENEADNLEQMKIAFPTQAAIDATSPSSTSPSSTSPSSVTAPKIFRRREKNADSEKRREI